ncbi:hypothetical protein AB0F68_07750 [Micromonospora sp. NPDC023966]|uniref:hypothetical protein n=1 Tax=Micromonospora sp. NPDC023966 TaxID=3154699 RepID=UPI0033E775F6
MPAVLTTDSTIKCAHSGTVVAQASTSALTAAGSPVLVQADLLAATVTGCTNTNTNAGETPCLKVTSVTAGLSTTLSVGGQPVLLDTAKGLTNATPPRPVLWQVDSAGQTVLEVS